MGDEQAAQDALNWLKQEQNEDGSWGATGAIEPLYTAEVVLALGAWQRRDGAYYRGITWLENHVARGIDYQARRLLVLAAHGDEVSAELHALQRAQRLRTPGNGGWGLSAGYDGAALDTALVLQALSALGRTDTGEVSTALAFLEHVQRQETSIADRGWGFSEGQASDVMVTAQVLQALRAFTALDATLVGSVAQGVSTLTALVDTSSPVVDKSQAALALLRHDSASGSARQWLDELLSAQSANGSWQDDAFLSALVVRVLAAAGGADTAALERVVHIPDARLRAALNAALGKAAGDALTVGELRQLTALDLSNLGISDLTGLEAASNLTSVELRGNAISALTPLQHVPNLATRFSPIAITSGAIPSDVASTLGARVNPSGLSTVAYLEWGSSVAYGRRTGEVSLGSHPERVSLTHHLTGLSPDTRYHYRVVARNAAAQVVGADVSFTTLEAIHRGPVAVADAAMTREETALRLAVLENDVDGGGQGLRIRSVTQPSDGTVSHDGTEMVYTPAVNFTGVNRWTYVLEEGAGDTAVGQVTVTVRAPAEFGYFLLNSPSGAPLDTTAFKVMSLVAGNTLTVGDRALALDRYVQQRLPAVADTGTGVWVRGTGPFDLVRDSASDGLHAGLPMALSFAGLQFQFTRVNTATTGPSDPTLHILSPYGDATVQLGTRCGGGVVTARRDTVLSLNARSLGTALDWGCTVQADLPVLVAFSDEGRRERFALYPSATELWGVRSGTVWVSALQADTEVTVYASDGTRGAYRVGLEPQAIELGDDSDQGRGSALHIRAAQPVVAVQGSDGDGFSGAALVGREALGRRYGLAAAGQYLGVVCPPSPVAATAITVDVYNAAHQRVSTQACEGDGLAPGKVYVGSSGHGAHIEAGSYIESDQPVYVLFEVSAHEQEQTLLGAVNVPPRAQVDVAELAEDTAVRLAVLSNDSDSDGDALTVTRVQPASHGTVTRQGSDFQYTPDTDFHGVDEFSYRVNDGRGGQDTTTVRLTVTPVNDTPVAADEAIESDEDEAVRVAVLDNDTDVDGDELHVGTVSAGAHGAVAIARDGRGIGYRPAADFHGIDQFVYTAADGHGGVASATVRVTVRPVNDAPVAVDQNETTAEEVGIAVRASVSDVDGDALSVKVLTPPGFGTVTSTDGGVLHYVPKVNFNGLDSFRYRVEDGQGGRAEATVTVQVVAVNDAPVAVADAVRTVGGIEIVVPVLANDVDVDGDALQVSAVTPAGHGEVSHDGTRIRYTPGVYFAGIERIDYTVVDGQGGSHSAALTITVEAPEVPAAPRLVEPPKETEVTILAPPLVVAHEIHDPRLEVGYEFELYEDPQMQVLVRRATVTAGAQTLTAWPVFPPLDADNQWYDWRARGFNAGGHSVWVYGDFFVNTENDAPGPLPLSAPGIGVEVDSLRPTLEVVNSVDVDQGTAPLTYVFAVYENDPGISPEVWPLVESSALAAGDEGVTAWRVEVALRENREYHWQVTVSDEHGARTRSDVGRFFVNTANEAPRSPAVAAPWVDEEVPTQAVRLQVHNAVDADRDTLHYTFELDRGETFDSAFQQRSERLPAGVGTTSWDVEGLADNTWYVWRVKADDGVAESGWTNGRFFVNTQNDAPSIPTVRNPGNGAWVETRRPALAVNASTDEDEDALDYEFELYTDLHRPAVLTSAVEVEPRYESTSWTPRMLLDDHRWYAWRARAVDEHGAASAPMEWQWFFVNDNGVDDAPELEWVLPYTDIEVPAEDGQVRLRWEDSDPDSNARVSLYYDRAGADRPVGTLIAADIEEDLDDWGDEYLWAVSGLAPGPYRVYAHIRDARNEVRADAPGVVTVVAPVPVQPGDLNGDGVTDVADFYQMAASYRACTGAPNFIARADYDADGCVTRRDMKIWYYDYYLTR